MDDDPVRRIGLIGGGAALLVALGVATFGADKPRAPAEDPPVAVSAQPSVAAVAPIPSPVIDTAMVDGPASRPVSMPQSPPRTAPKDTPVVNPDLEFIVRFDDRHPLSRAQALYLQGKHADAAASAREILARRRELSGLCFERFTFGAEIVLSNCTAVPRAQAERVSARWARKLRAMDGVQYVDANVLLTPENR